MIYQIKCKAPSSRSILIQMSLQDYMGQLTGGRSVPRVFIEGKFIGGGQETTALDKQGKLQGMLKEAGAI